jgi:hypothetical protein
LIKVRKAKNGWKGSNSQRRKMADKKLARYYLTGQIAIFAAMDLLREPTRGFWDLMP